MSTPRSQTSAQQPHNPRKVVGDISGDKADLETRHKITPLNGQVDAGQVKDSKKRMDLSRLQKRLGPKHVALIHALKNVDPQSPHGQELASIIQSLG